MNDVRGYVSYAIDLLEQHALNRDRVDWEEVRSEMLARAAEASSVEDAYELLRTVIALLGDGHSFLRTPANAREWHSGQMRNDRPSVVVDDGIASVRIDGYAGTEPRAAVEWSSALQRELMVGSSAIGWIVDLRGNWGGNMWPMLSGLAPILGEGTLGYFVDRDGVAQSWSYEDGATRLGSESMLTVPNPLPCMEPLPDLAVLISAKTKSSGEAIALAFRGQDRTRLFGQQTAGLATRNDSLALPDGAALILTTAVMADRTGDTAPVTPDVPVPVDMAEAEARRWLSLGAS